MVPTDTNRKQRRTKRIILPEFTKKTLTRNQILSERKMQRQNKAKARMSQ